MSINFETNIITGTVAYAKIFVPSKKYGKEDQYELCIDVFVSEDDADLWDDKFPKQKARQVKTAEFEGIYKIPAPFPHKNWRTRQTTTSPTLHCHTPTFGTPRTVTRQSAKWSSRKASTSPRFTPPEGR
jgi:hypothetical protein